jgi:hypothetical protein
MKDAWIAASAQGRASAAEAGTTLPVRMRGTQPGHEQGPHEDRDQGLNQTHGEIAEPLSMKPMLKHVSAQKARLVCPAVFAPIVVKAQFRKTASRIRILQRFGDAGLEASFSCRQLLRYRTGTRAAGDVAAKPDASLPEHVQEMVNNRLAPPRHLFGAPRAGDGRRAPRIRIL